MPKRKYVHDLWGRQLYGNRGIAVHRNVHTKQLIDPYTKPKNLPKQKNKSSKAYLTKGK